MKKGRFFSQYLIWFFMAVAICGVIAAGILTNLTLRSIEKNLPTTLLAELNALALVLENLNGVVHAAERAAADSSTRNVNLLRTRIDKAYTDIVALRETYVIDNLVQASAFHAVVAPAIADLQIWLSDGVSGFGPDTDTTAAIAFARIDDAYQKARSLIRESRNNAQDIMEKQRVRLDRFLFSVNLLFASTIAVTLSMVYLLIRQYALQVRENRAREELHRQRDLLDSLFENALLGITVWDRNGGLLLANRGFTEITGYSTMDIRTLADWFPKAYPDPEYRRKVVAVWQEPSNGEGIVREFNVTCRNGAVKEIEFRGISLPDGRALVTMADITERKMTERIVQETREIKARYRKMESLGLLAGGVAHDLNNILSGIVSYPDLLLLDLPEDSNLRKPIQIMQEAGQRAAAIVLDLLTVARGVATVKEPLKLNELVSAYMNSPEFDELSQFHRTISFQTDLDPKLLNISGSSVHVRKALMNLVSNAAEAIPERGSITISTANRYLDEPFVGYDDFKEGEYVVLSVSDDGSGISKTDLERIFEPFYSKKVMGRSGTGLGLAVVWSVVQDHGGFVDVKSEPGRTAFNLYFPVTREKISDKAFPASIEDFRGNGERILVVDDIASQREIVCSMLERLGYAPSSVSSGEEAIAFLKQHDAELIVLDMIMEPGINGRQTYERILAFKAGQKAIITSGFAETDEVKKTQKLGAGGYIRKPFSLEDLGRVIREELSKGTTNGA